MHLRNTASRILYKPKQRNIWNLSNITQKRQMLQILLNNFRVKVWMICYVWLTCWMSKKFWGVWIFIRAFQNGLNEPNNIFISKVKTKKQLKFVRNITAGNFRITSSMAIKFSNLVDFNNSFLKWDEESSHHLWFVKYYLIFYHALCR